MLNDTNDDLFWLRYKELENLFFQRNPIWFVRIEKTFKEYSDTSKTHIIGNLAGSCVMSANFAAFAVEAKQDIDSFLGALCIQDPLLSIERVYTRIITAPRNENVFKDFQHKSNTPFYKYRKAFLAAPKKRRYLYYYLRFRFSLFNNQHLRATIYARKALTETVNGWQWRDLLSHLSRQTLANSNTKPDLHFFKTVMGGIANIRTSSIINAPAGLYGLPVRNNTIVRENVYVGTGTDISMITSSGETAYFSSAGNLIRPFCSTLGSGFENLQLSMEPGREIEDPCIILTAYYGIQNYSHACLDQIPRLSFIPNSVLAEYGKNIIIDANAPEFTKELLRVNLPHSKLVEVENAVLHKFKKACLVSTLSHPAHNVHENCIEFFKNLVESAKKLAPEFSLPSDRIYIQRPSGRRGILNAEPTETLLDSFGFTTLRLEELRVEEQILAFASSRIIVASHGAALGNLAFCQPGTHVIEVFQRRYGIPSFQILASMKGLLHYAMVDSRYTNDKSNASFKFEDIEYPLEHMQKLLYCICKQPTPPKLTLPRIPAMLSGSQSS